MQGLRRSTMVLAACLAAALGCGASDPDDPGPVAAQPEEIEEAAAPAEEAVPAAGALEISFYPLPVIFPEVFTIGQATIVLKSVSYSGPSFRTVLRDDASAEYAAPHWEDRSDPLDGEATGPEDHRFPVSYTRNTKMVLSATWVVNPPAAFANSRVRGTGPDGLRVAPTPAQINGDLLSIVDAEAGDLPDQVKFYNPFVMRWEISIGNAAWLPIGDSDNRVYVMLADPVDDPKRYETVLEVGARAADGSDEPAEVITEVWGEFSDPVPGVERKAIDGHNRPDGVEMTYWKPVQGHCTAMEQMIVAQQGNGTCSAWAVFLREVLRNLGVPGAQVMKVESTYTNDNGLPIPNRNGETRGGLLVKQWATANPGMAQAACAPFTHLRNQVQERRGVPGQGNRDPVSAFVEHFIVQIGSELYDPSYGGPVHASQADWEDASIALFSKVCAVGQNPVVYKANAAGAADIETRLTAQ